MASGEKNTTQSSRSLFSVKHRWVRMMKMTGDAKEEEINMTTGSAGLSSCRAWMLAASTLVRILP